MLYIGFDLGDGESCISYKRNENALYPDPAQISGQDSFITAVGKLNGKILVGQNASNANGIEDLQVCFKRRFRENVPITNQAISDFVAGTLDELRRSQELGSRLEKEEHCFVVGCPAGWNAEERDRYKRLLISAGLKKVELISESRAAVEYALRDTKNPIDAALLKKSVLVIDIGSSTLDFAYVRDGNEYDIQTMGNVLLGGGLLDEMVVLYAVEQIKNTDSAKYELVRQLVDTVPTIKSKLMVESRKIKENYFTNESIYLSNNQPLIKTVHLFHRGQHITVDLIISPQIVLEWLIAQPHPLLEWDSFENRLNGSLSTVHNGIINHVDNPNHEEPALVILTGGASRMRFFQDICKNHFIHSHMIVSDRPELDIARGLVFAGSMDERVKACIADLREYVNGDAVEKKVNEAYPELVKCLGEPLVDNLMEKSILPTFRKWKSSAIATLNDFQNAVTDDVEYYLKSSEGESSISSVVKPWSEKVIREVNADVFKICLKHQLDMEFARKNLTLIPEGMNSSLDISFVNILQAVTSAVVIVVIAMLCGGAGLALIMEGFVGLIIGGLIGLVIVFLGKNTARDWIMKQNFLPIFRVPFSENVINTEKNKARLLKDITSALANDENTKNDLIRQVSQVIDDTINTLTSNVESSL